MSERFEWEDGDFEVTPPKDGDAETEAPKGPFDPNAEEGE